MRVRNLNVGIREGDGRFGILGVTSYGTIRGNAGLLVCFNYLQDGLCSLELGLLTESYLIEEASKFSQILYF